MGRPYKYKTSERWQPTINAIEKKSLHQKSTPQNGHIVWYTRESRSPQITQLNKVCDYVKETSNMDVEDTTYELKTQGVTNVEQVKGRKNGQLIPADLYILTIKSPYIPPQMR